MQNIAEFHIIGRIGKSLKKTSHEGQNTVDRLMSLADVYDALTTLRPYKRPWTHEEASAEIHRLAGTKFDPEVVAAFDALR